ncbi:hypothetical protein Tsubulata_032260 [Turnera subulata]|uniref:C2H2-type domain-containing protein n=1 Tax=Turnera subulata TaxID=218843 RepID=A0A9Q0FAA7_9ROSI|nr:hypothetical protein Tsubulata_032260 [Turnera subulata]
MGVWVAADPDAEVIALSPKTLMATNRFICEVCNKGFQREQNLQLHRRGHNLPWKLKQKTTKEVKRKVYLCPEPTCVHHDPSRALGDLTGIKKHYSRKHGEKKWKCEKCSKRYAVQSDWKAHSKTCGTREYRCDCGTLFSRRDSFITHRAFCDALAQESARNPPASLNTIGSHLYGGSNMSLGLSQVGTQITSMQDHHSSQSNNDILRLGSGSHHHHHHRGSGQFDHLLGAGSSSFRPPQQSPMASSGFFMQDSTQNYHDEHQSPQGLLQNKPFHQGLMQFADLHNTAGGNNPPSVPNLFNLSFLSGNNNSSNNNNSASSNLPSSGLVINPNQFNSQNNNGGSGGGGGEGSNLLSGNMMGGDQMTSGMPSLFSSSVQNENVIPHMSATALLQKAAQMGSTSSNNNINSSASLLRSFGGGSSSSGNKATGDRAPPPVSGNFGAMFGENESNQQLHELMHSIAAAGNTGIFGSSSSGHSHLENPLAGGGGAGGGGGGGGYSSSAASRTGLEQEKQRHGGPNFGNMEDSKLHQQNMNASMGGSDRLTRDFLGVGQIVRSMSGGFPHREKHHPPPPPPQQQQQQQQHGMDMGSSLDSETTNIAAPTNQSFGGNGSFHHHH